MACMYGNHVWYGSWAHTEVCEQLMNRPRPEFFLYLRLPEAVEAASRVSPANQVVLEGKHVLACNESDSTGGKAISEDTEEALGDTRADFSKYMNSQQDRLAQLVCTRATASTRLQSPQRQ